VRLDLSGLSFGSFCIATIEVCSYHRDFFFFFFIDWVKLDKINESILFGGAFEKLAV